MNEGVGHKIMNQITHKKLQIHQYINKLDLQLTKIKGVIKKPKIITEKHISF